MKSRTLWLICVLLAAACSQDTTAHKEEPMPVEDTAFGPMVDQMHRAEERAKQMEGRMKDLNQQLEGAEGTSGEKPAE